MSDDDLSTPPPVSSDGPAEPATAPEATGNDRRTVKQEQRRQLIRTPSFIIGVVIVGFWVLCALVPDVIAPYTEGESVRNAAGDLIPRAEPSGDALLGTDKISRDVFSRIIYGADNILVVAPVAALLSVIAGAVLGLLMGYYRGWIDEVIGRVIEAILSLPVILLILMVLVVFGSSRATIILTIAGLFTPVVTRTVRASVLSESDLDYVMSAKLRDESSIFIMLREILPNITNVLVVEFTVRVGYAIFTVATLNFLGLSADDATAADWGVDIAESYGLIQSGQWWISVFPAIAIASLVIGVNLIADSINKVYSS